MLVHSSILLSFHIANNFRLNISSVYFKVQSISMVLKAWILRLTEGTQLTVVLYWNERLPFTLAQRACFRKEFSRYSRRKYRLMEWHPPFRNFSQFSSWIYFARVSSVTLHAQSMSTMQWTIQANWDHLVCVSVCSQDWIFRDNFKRDQKIKIGLF